MLTIANMLRGQGGYKIRLKLAIRTPGYPLKFLLIQGHCDITELVKSFTHFML